MIPLDYRNSLHRLGSPDCPPPLPPPPGQVLPALSRAERLTSLKLLLVVLLIATLTLVVLMMPSSNDVRHPEGSIVDIPALTPR